MTKFFVFNITQNNLATWMEENPLNNHSVQLPPLPEPLIESYETWHNIYDKWAKQSPTSYRIVKSDNQPKELMDAKWWTEIEECEKTVNQLKIHFNSWLNNNQNPNWVKFRDNLRDSLKECQKKIEEIVVVIETQNSPIERLPWHIWDVFEEFNVEVILKLGYKNKNNTLISNKKHQNKVKLLVLKGSGDEIDTRGEEQIILDNLKSKGAEIKLLKEPKRDEFDILWKDDWDIFYFTGHSHTKTDAEAGKRGGFRINPNDFLYPNQLEGTFGEAIKNGLKLAIFNSCDGFGIAEELSRLSLPMPQIIFMREPIPDRVAIKFLKYFLDAFSSGNSLYKSVGKARKKLKELENVEKEFPGVTWMPLIAVNTDKSLTWHEFFDNPEPDPPVDIDNTNIILKNRYRIIEQLGEGAFSKTYLAEDKNNNNNQCLVKKLAPINSDSKIAKSLFDREIETLKKLQHQQIPTFIDNFEEGEEIYLVEGYIKGTPLNQEITFNTTWEEQKVILFLEDVLLILKYLHEKNVIHRDIKPSNLIKREEDNKLVLIDFGAVKKIDSQLFTSCASNNPTIVYTKGYTSPEQQQGQASPNSDIYSLGMIAVQALTGIHPKDLQQGTKTGQIIWQQSAMIKNYKLATLLNKMIHQDSSKRYQSVEEVLKKLRELRDEPWWIKYRYPLGTLSLIPILCGVEFIHPFIRPIYYLHQGNALLDSYRPEEALEKFDQIIDIQPNTNNAEVWNGRGDALYGSGRYEGALESYKKADTLYPNNPKTLNNLGKILYKLSDYANSKDKRNHLMQEALKYHKIALKYSIVKRDKAEAWSGQGIVLKGLDKCQEASNAFDNARTETPNKPNVWIEKASVLNSCLRQPDEAKRIYEEALAEYDKELNKNPSYLTAWVDRGDVLNKLKLSPEKELDSYEQALKINPDFHPALIAKGTVLNRLGRYNEELETYDRALIIRPKNYLILYNRGRLLAEKLNQREKALESFTEAVKLSPTFFDALSAKGETLNYLKKYNEAIIAFEQAIKIKPNDALAWANLAYALKNTGNKEKALDSYNKAVDLHSKKYDSSIDEIINEVIKDRDDLKKQLGR